jgi:SSS family transporter
MTETNAILGLPLLDWSMVFLYLIAITWIGYRTKSVIHTREDFYMAGRRFGKVLMIFHSFGAGTHSDQAVAVAGACYRNGMSGIWAQWQWMFTTPFYWLLAPVFRRSRCLTTAELYYERFGPSASLLFVMVSVISMTLNLGIMLQGTGLVISSMTNGAISQTMAVCIMTVSFLVYGVAGGLVAAVVTDLIQGIFIFFLSFLLVPFGLIAVGGLTGIREHASPEILQLISAHSINLPVILLLSLNAMVGIVAQSQIMATTSAGKTEWEGRVGMTYGNFLKRICTAGWALIGVCAIVLFPELGAQNQSEHAFGYAVSHLLPTGLRGIMLASIMAAAMSTCDALMISTSALLTDNVYRAYIKPGKDEKHYLFSARMVSFFVVLISILFSALFPTVLEGAFTFFQLTASIGLSFWMGIFWRRMNTAGVFASFICATGTLAIAKFWIFPVAVYGVTPAIAYQTLLFIPAGLVSGWLISLLTPPTDSSIVDRFFVKIHTPIGQEEKLSLSLEQAIPPQDRWFDWGGLFIVKPNQESWIGFLVACLFVFILIAATQVLLSL